MRAAPKPPPADEHGDILVHMLGLEDGRGPWRDHYCADEADPALMEMERLGLVKRLAPSKILAASDRMFVSTPAGRVRGLKRWEAIRPRPTRGQRMYAAYLRVSDVCSPLSFRVFLTDPYFAECRKAAA